MLVGLFFTGLFLIPFVLYEKRRSWELGVTNGIIQGKGQAADALGKELGFTRDATNSKVLFSVKASQVIAVETNGIKTVRVIP